MKKIRLRYAPSPTGYLHIGNTRTALMNFLFAKHHGGDFIVRIEDTDLERNVADAIDSQFDNMEWLGIIPDESIKKPIKKYGPYIQSAKFDEYKKYALGLIDKDLAYRCFCSETELEAERELQTSRGIVATKYNGKCQHLSKEEISKNLSDKKPFNIRFRVPNHKIYEIDDLVRGRISFDSNELGDFVILKTNGIATYNFAVVIDDKDMEITHVVRGEEHISNTPRQLMIYDAFGWERPLFCHLTLIVDDTRKKLSKRSGNALFFISQYRSQGYLPEAVFNFTALLGWSPKEEKEIFSISELIKAFDETRFSKSPSTFDMKKLKWMNNQWMKKIDNQYYLNFIREFIDQTKFSLTKVDSTWLDEVLLLFKNEISSGIEINDHIEMFFDNIKLSEDTKVELKSFGNLHDVISDLKIAIKNLKIFDVESIKELIKAFGQKHSLKGRELFMPIRIATTSSQHGPELAKTIFLMGLDKVLKNIDKLR